MSLKIDRKLKSSKKYTKKNIKIMYKKETLSQKKIKEFHQKKNFYNNGKKANSHTVIQMN